MKYITTVLSLSAILAHSLTAQEVGPAQANGGETFEYHVGEVSWLTGEGIDGGGFLFPSLYVSGTGGAFESGANPEDFSSSEHDPQNKWGVQAVELHLDLNFNEEVTGTISGFAQQGESHVWEATLEEAYLHWHLNDILSIGGGQFLNAFGFQSDLHVHDWSFVNQNLVNSRMLNEGELVSQGGVLLVRTPSSGLLTFALGGVRTHAHDHGHGDDHDEHGEEEHHDEEEHEEEDHHDEHEEEHFEADEAGFQSWVLTSDYRFRLPFDDSMTGTASLALGENGFDRNTYVYGLGLRKVWNGHDHGFGGPDFCSGAVMFQSEIVGREVEAYAEDGDALEFDDYGFSNSIHYGMSDRVTVSLRHDWISAVEVAELSDRHRISTALTAFVDPEQRVRARVQYDYNQDDTIGSEHVAWFQIQLQWGGTGGSHAGHGH